MALNRTVLDQPEMTALARIELLKRYVFALEEEFTSQMARLRARLLELEGEEITVDVNGG